MNKKMLIFAIILLIAVLVLLVLIGCKNQKKEVQTSRINEDVLNYFDLTYEQAIEQIGISATSMEMKTSDTVSIDFKGYTQFRYDREEFERDSMNAKPKSFVSQEFIIGFEDGLSADELDEIFGQKQPMKYDDKNWYFKEYIYKEYKVLVLFGLDKTGTVASGIVISN